MDLNKSNYVTEQLYNYKLSISVAHRLFKIYVMFVTSFLIVETTVILSRLRSRIGKKHLTGLPLLHVFRAIERNMEGIIDRFDSRKKYVLI